MKTKYLTHQAIIHKRPGTSGTLGGYQYDDNLNRYQTDIKKMSSMFKKSFISWISLHLNVGTLELESAIVFCHCHPQTGFRVWAS